jgi:hypothetical protein
VLREVSALYIGGGVLREALILVKRIWTVASKQITVSNILRRRCWVLREVPAFYIGGEVLWEAPKSDLGSANLDGRK